MFEKKLKHLEFIQGAITRMASNSFALKGWSVVFVSGLFALAAKDANVGFVYLAYFPASAFWILDGFYLRQEKLYRALYQAVCIRDEASIDFTMDARPFEVEVDSWLKVTMSTTLRLFHGTIIATILVVMVICLIASAKQ